MAGRPWHEGRLGKTQMEKLSSWVGNGNFDYPKAKEGGSMRLLFPSIFPHRIPYVEGYPKKFAESRISMTEQLADTYQEEFAMAYTPPDVEANFNAGKNQWVAKMVLRWKTTFHWWNIIKIQ